jgi:hypothetical protein
MTACARCGEDTTGKLTYRTTVSGGTRTVKMTGSNDERGAMHKGCANARKSELDARDEEVRNQNRQVFNDRR